MNDDFGLGEVFISMFWFMILFAWILLLFHVLGDIFRDHELSGGLKAVWCLFIIFLPWLGVLVYLIVRGRSMNERSLQQAQAADAAMRAYVQEAAGTSGGVSAEIEKLAGLRDSGVLTPEEYEVAKSKALA
jgi:Phospholipase_D-nuclease N-terminal/Short C-terminal domain